MSQSDLKLVTTNAKTFNPPGTIYHTEAERIESYALEHITKAAATVIEYETDWNIDVEHDDPLAVDDDDAAGGTPMDKTMSGTPMDVDEPPKKTTAPQTKKKAAPPQDPPPEDPPTDPPTDPKVRF